MCLADFGEYRLRRVAAAAGVAAPSVAEAAGG